jgi:hypothetical protein
MHLVLMISLGFPIGGDLFDERFATVLRTKLRIDMSPKKEQAFFEPFVDYFHRRSKPQWPDHFKEGRISLAKMALVYGCIIHFLQFSQ